MNFKELVAELSQETGLPAGKVRKLAQAMLAKMAALVDEGGQFKSPTLRIRTLTRPARTLQNEDGTQRHIPERRVTRLVRPKAKRQPQVAEHQG